MRLNEFVSNYKFIRYVSSQDQHYLDDINEQEYHHQYRQFNAKRRTNEYPLGKKNQTIFNEINCHTFIFKEQYQTKGHAIFVIQNILLNGEIKKVANLIKLKMNIDFCDEGKRQWRNFFIDLIKKKDEIIEFSDCDFIYSLISKEDTNAMKSIVNYRKNIGIKNLADYQVFNIFPRKNMSLLEKMRHPVKIARLEDIEDILELNKQQATLQQWRDGKKLNRSQLEIIIELNNCFIIRDKHGELLGYVTCVEKRLNKEQLEQIDPTYKMAGSLLPIFDVENDKEENFINLLHIEDIDFTPEINPLERIAVCTSLLIGIINYPRYKYVNLIKLQCFKDRVIEKSCENFFAVRNDYLLYKFLEKVSEVDLQPPPKEKENVPA